ncbi:MAG: hypothetical protein AAGC95_05945 [Pseudomonadota bacterium]
MLRRMYNRRTISLSATALGLAAAILLQLWPIVSYKPDQMQSVVENPAPATIDTRILLEARLFALEDLPPPAPTPSQTAPARVDIRTRLRPYTLVGVVIADEEPTLIVKDDRTQNMLFLTVASELEGFKISAIDAVSATLVSGETEAVLQLPEDGQTKLADILLQNNETVR